MKNEYHIGDRVYLNGKKGIIISQLVKNIISDEIWFEVEFFDTGDIVRCTENEIIFSKTF